MAQQARAVVTRSAIIRGAASVFQERGYGSSSLADVCTEAGVTKGALYFHFDSKEALARAIIDAQHASSSALGQELLESKTPGLHAMIIMSFELAVQLKTDPVVSAGVRLTVEAANFDAPVGGPYLDWIVACEEFLRRGIVEGAIVASTDVAATARFIISAFTGVQIVSDVLTGRDDIEQRLLEMWDIILPALVPPAQWPAVRELARRMHAERS